MIDFRLAPKPVSYLEPLQAMALGQQAARQRAADARAEADRQRQDQTRATVSTRLGAKDYAGAETAALSGGDTELAGHIATLDASTRARVADGFQTIGALAYSLKQVPLEERAARFQAALPLLRAHGLTDDVLQHADLSDAGLDGYVNASLSVKDQIAQANEVATRNKPMVVGADSGVFDPASRSMIVAPQHKLEIRTVTNADGTESIVPVDPYTGQPGAVAARGDSGPAPSGTAHPGAVALDGNNPGGIIDSKFARGMPGYQGANGRFAKFATMQDGINAQTQLLQSYVRRGINTPLAIASKWAPASDGNDPASYAANIARAMGIGVHDKIGAEQIAAFQRAQATQENHMYGSRLAAGSGEAPSGGAVFTSHGGTPGDAGMDDKGLDYVADIYRRTGQLPPLGMGKAAAGLRTRIIQRAQQRDAAEGISGTDAVSVHYDTKAGGASLAQQEKNADAVIAAERTALANGQQFLDRSRELHGQTHYPWLNSVVNMAQRAAGGETVKSMDIARDTFLTEYAKVVAGSPSGAGVLSDSARNNALGLISGNATYQQKVAAFEQLQRDMHNRVEALEHQQAAIRARLRGGGTSGAVRHISNDSEYDALPSGAHFVGPDGHERVKP